jgi:hypothetical protein
MTSGAIALGNDDHCHLDWGVHETSPRVASILGLGLVVFSVIVLEMAEGTGPNLIFLISVAPMEMSNARGTTPGVIVAALLPASCMSVSEIGISHPFSDHMT